MKTAFLSLGSNLGDRESNLRQALASMEAAGVHTVKSSPVYETEPQGLRDQPWFLNLVVQVETELFPLQLLHCLQKIESSLGRRRGQPQGPRPIDIDILLIGSCVIQTAELVVPHPRMHVRRFVLSPLAEIAPQVRHPVLGKTARELLAAIVGQEVRRTGLDKTSS